MPPRTTTAKPDDDRRIIDSIRVLVRELRSSSQASEQATGLSAAQLFVLRTLAREPGLGINDLAARVLTHQSSVSVVVSKLEAAGMVKRKRSSADGRGVSLYPTAKGQAIAVRSPDPIQERLFAGLRHLPLGTRRRLAADLGRWIHAIGVQDHEPEMFYEPKGDNRPAATRRPRRL